MTKCPNCSEVNTFENLFCKGCGRCLLAPDPEKIQWATVTPPGHQRTGESAEFYEAHMVKNLKVTRLKPGYQTPPVIAGGLLLLNVLVIITVAEIMMYLTR